MQNFHLHLSNDPSEASIARLAEYLKSEMTAVETYERALEHIDHVAIHHELQQILTSHGRRVDSVRERLRNRGAESIQSAGVWGALAVLLQSGANLLGARAAVAALEEGEDRGLELYRADLRGLDVGVQRLVLDYLLPEQERTHSLCRTLHSYLRHPS